MKHKAQKSIIAFCGFAFVGSILASLFADALAPDLGAVALFFLIRSRSKRSQRGALVLVIAYIIVAVMLAGFALLNPTSVNFGARALTPEEAPWVVVYMAILTAWSTLNLVLLIKGEQNKSAHGTR